MHPDWASQNLQVIRTLMERSAVYRRALTPVMILAGAIGIVGAMAGGFCKIESSRSFMLYWIVINVVVSGGAFLLIRRQALKDSEPFWSPPTRRVAQAFLPCFFAAGILSVIFLFGFKWEDSGIEKIMAPVWMMFYGCGLHAAGFFMPRGIRLLGWIFLGSGSVLLSGLILVQAPFFNQNPHLFMGIAFGGFHLAYGLYLYFTEKRDNAA